MLLAAGCALALVPPQTPTEVVFNLDISVDPSVRPSREHLSPKLSVRINGGGDKGLGSLRIRADTQRHLEKTNERGAEAGFRLTPSVLGRNIVRIFKSA